jgi:hypothetical protein
MGIPAVPLPLSHSMARRPATPGGLALRADQPAFQRPGRLPLGEARDLEQAPGMLGSAMDAEQVWSDVWFASDHGKPQRLDPGGRD